ncbi:MAG: diguanylate cyclase domain-containing protein, partial [Janthinobacterium lividum]
MIEAIVHEHDLRLVTLAVVICVLACFTSLKLIVRGQAGAGIGWGWLAAAAAVFGCGVWSLHFLAMLAYMPGMAIDYDIRMTIVSAIIVIVGTFAALLAWQSIPVKFTAAWFGGVLLGLTVTAMHYCGVAAMQMPDGIRFDRELVVTSILVGTAFAILAFMRGSALSLLSRRIEISGWLMLCVCSVHFIGMGALTIDARGSSPLSGGALGTGPLAIAVSSVSLAILVVSLAATLMEQHLLQRSVLELRRMRLMSDISHEILIIERNGLILQVNEAGSRLFGILPAQLVGRPMIDLISTADQGIVARYLRSVPDHLKPESIQVRAAAGHLIPVELACSTIDYEGGPAIVMAIRDMSDRTRDEARIRHLAHHDALTDLPNRFLMRTRLTYAIDAAARSRSRVALLQFDLDRFKPVNELLGHIAGDALLIQVAARLRAELDTTDTLARIGGDEFAIVMMTDRVEQIASLAARVLETIARPFDLDGTPVEIGTSIGISLFPDDGGTSEALVQAANTAMYRVKEEKGGAFRFFEAQMNEHLHARRQLEQDLRHAVDRDQFELYYQPLFNCSTN